MATKLGTLTLDLVARVGSFTQGMRQASTTAEREMRRIESSVITVDSMLKKLAITAGATFSVAQVANYADSYTGMVNKLKLVTENQMQLSTAMSDTHKIAQSTASDWSGVLDVYTKFQGLSKRLGIDQAEVARITETVTKTVSMSGQSATASEAALLQFGQALNTGFLRGAELTSVMSQAPALAKAIADGMGVAIGDLKKLGEEGKLTSEVMRDALLKMSSSVDAEYAKTATAIESSFNYIKNESIKIIGEFDNATGASLAFVESMKAVSENMDIVVSTMIIGGVYMAGTYIPTIYAATVSLGEKAVAQLASMRADQLANEITAQRTARIAHLTAVELANAEAQLVRMTGIARLAYLEATVIPLRQANTVALTADTVAQKANNQSKNLGALATGRLATALMGPVGIGIALATVAAGYLLMKDGAEKATSSIDIQGKSVADLVVKYRELNTLQRDNETKALADQVEDLSLKYRVASSDLYAFMEALPVSDEKIATFNKLRSELSQGRISSNEYYEAVKSVNILTDSQLGKVRALAVGYVDAKTKFNEAENAQDALAKSMDSTTQKAKEQAKEVAGLSNEIKKLLSTNKESILKNTSLNAMIGAGADPKLADYLYEARKAQGILGTSKMLSEEVRKSVIARYNSETGLNKTLEERNKLEEKNKKLVEAQGAAMKVNALVAQNAAKAQADALESAKNLPKGILSAVNMVESPLSNSAKSGAGARGPMQFMSATADRYKVDVKSVESSYRGASNYLKDLLKMFDGDIENALRAYNWGEGNMQNYLKYGSGMKKENGKWQKGYFADKPMPKETRQYSGKVIGYMGGASGISFNEDYSHDDWFKEQEKFSIEREKLEKEQAKKQLDLTNLVATEKVRINSKLAEDIKSIEESGFTDTESKNLIAEYQRRADIDIQIAEATQADKFSTYSDYMKTEEQLINQSYARRQRDLKLDIQFTADQYTEASLHLEKQRVQEIEKIKRTEKLDILEAKRDWMEKGEYASEYYALIRAEILETSEYSPEMKNALVKQANIQQGMDQNVEREQVWGDYKSMMGLEDSPYQQDMDLLAEARAQMLITEEEYQQQRLGMQMKYGTAYGSDFAGMLMGLVDQSSSAYAGLYAIQRGFNLASAIMSGYTAIAAAWASAAFPYNMPAVAMATMETGVLQAAISAISPVGMAHNGIDNIPKEGTWLLDGGERVLNPQQNKDLTKYLNDASGNSQSSTPNVNLNPNFVIVDERESMSDYLFSPDGTKAFVKFFKRNRSALGV